MSDLSAAGDPGGSSPGGAGAGEWTAQPEPHAQALLSMLRLYTVKQHSARVAVAELAGFVKQYAGRYSLKLPQLNEFSQHTEGMVDTYLRALSERGLCSLELDGQEARWVVFPQFYLEVIAKAYRAIEARPELPFPTEESLRLSLPANMVTDIDIRTDFVSTLSGLQPAKGSGPEKPGILRLSFPDAVNSMIVSSDLVQRKLLEISVAKMRAYMEARNNSSYVMHRLAPALRGHEHALRDLIGAIIQKPGRAVSTLLEPTDFSFRFWAHLANLLLREFREVGAKTPEEHGYCQAAYLLGFYNVHYRAAQQKQSERERLLKRFEGQFRKFPYAYTLRDLQALRDEKGSPLVGRDSRAAFLEFLERKTQAEGYEALPELVRVRTATDKEYYIHRDLVVPLFVKLLHEKGRELREHFEQEWEAAVREGRRTPAMNGDAEFGRELDMTLKSRAPFLHALLNYNLLVLAKAHGKTEYDTAKALECCLDEKLGHLRPLPQILGFSRKEVLESAKLRVPIWQRLRLFKGVYHFFQRLLRGLREAAARARAGRPTRKARAAEAPHAPAGAAAEGAASPAGEATTLRPATARQMAAYRRALQDLKEELVGADKTIPERLSELMEKWNPLYDSRARTNLVEDVNAMVRDVLRNLRRGFRASPPDAARIRALAEKLSANRAFERIKRKDLFIRYIEIYMLKLLGQR